MNMLSRATTVASSSTAAFESGILLIPSNDGNNSDEVIDAVQSVIRKCPAAQALRYTKGHTVLDSEIPFEIAPGIQCALVHDDEEGSNFGRIIRLSSKTQPVQKVQAFIDDCVAQYRLELQNKLGGRLYVFDQLPINTTTMQELNLPSMPKLQFEKQRFQTGKCFKNIFFTQKQLVESRVRFFIDRPDWYLEKGVAHSLGILLTGPPGTGKTSLIKAIARETDRHIVNVNMAAIETKQQFANLFHGDDIQCRAKDMGERCESLNIPVADRILVLEDIDCAASNITWDRKLLEKMKEEEDQKRKQDLIEQLMKSRQHPSYYNDSDEECEDSYYSRQPRQQQRQSESTTGPMSLAAAYKEIDHNTKPRPKPQHSNAITLSDVLNVLDGVVENPGRIVIMTSNHIEKIDSALLRPGRIDVTVEFGLSTQHMIADMYACYFDKELPTEYVSRLPQLKYSPAHISSVMLGCFNQPDEALKQLLALPDSAV